MGEGMSKCFAFDEWFEICNKLYKIYWLCWKACVTRAERFKKNNKEKFREILSRCPHDCEEKTVEYAMKKYGLDGRQAVLCMHME